MPWKDKSKYQSETYREYMRNYQRAWHQEHKAERIAQIRERRGRLREFLKQLKENLECSQCGEKHPATLHFHHLDPQAKDFNLAEAIEHGYSLERIQKEIEKCIVLCANCHAKLHRAQNMGASRPVPKEKGIKGAMGAESEAVIAAALIQAGYTVLTPNGYMHRYDLVIEDANGEFWKIQCKTAWLVDGGNALNFSTASLLQAGQRGRKVSIRKTYKNDVHYFAVYSPDTRKVYLIPIEDTPNTTMCLRLTNATKNGQAKRVNYAAAYEL